MATKNSATSDIGRMVLKAKSIRLALAFSAARMTSAAVGARLTTVVDEQMAAADGALMPRRVMMGNSVAMRKTPRAVAEWMANDISPARMKPPIIST